MSREQTWLANARSAAKRYREDKRKHRQLCRTCTQFRPGRARWCDQGWEIEKMIRLADSEIEALQAEIAAQPSLF